MGGGVRRVKRMKETKKEDRDKIRDKKIKR